MTNKKPAKRGPGRPPKPQDEKPEQFSVRLPPTIKIALEILVADSNLSLSSAVELAVTQLLSSHALSNGMTAEEVVQKIETQPLPARLMSLYAISPRFLEFQDRALIEGIYASDEFVDAFQEKEASKKTRKTLEAHKFVFDNWREISAALRGNWAKRIKRYSLRDLIAPPPPDETDTESLFFKKTA